MNSKTVVFTNTLIPLLLAVEWLALPIPQAQAQDNPPPLPLANPKLKTVAAFKNGLGFCVKSGSVQLQDGWAALEPLPAAALGALWLGTGDKAGPVTDLVAYKEKTT